MFGFDPISLGIGGAVLGGLMGKKDPLKGALTGAALGGTAGLLAPAAGTAAAGGGLVGAANVGGSMGGAQGLLAGGNALGAGLGGSIPGAATAAATEAAPTGLLAQITPYAKGAQNVIGAASAANSLAGGNQPMPVAPAGQVGGTPGTQLGQNGLTSNQRRQRGLLG